MDNLIQHCFRRDSHQQLHFFPISRHLSLHGRVQKDGYCRRHGFRGYLCHGPGLRPVLSGKPPSERPGSEVYADGCLYPGHRGSGAAGGDVPEKDHSHPLSGPGRLPPSYHHQLRRPGRGAAERAGGVQLH